MAVNESGNQNGNLAEGATDGVYKKVVTNRGGIVEGTTEEARQGLADVWYGIHETRRKSLGDGTVHVTPGYVGTPPV